MKEYIVQNGDTLSSIAEKNLGNRNRWSEIAQLNGLQEPYQLFVGQKLKLPFAPPNSLSNDSAVPQQIRQETPASLALARGYMFVVFEQLPDIGTGKLIRKVAVIPKDFSLLPPNPSANISIAEHALGSSSNSQFLSTSNKPFGAPSIEGKPLIIDLTKTQATGAKVFTVEEVVADLRRFASQNPASQTRVNQLIWAVEKVEGETLIEGGVPGDAVKRVSTAHSPYISTSEELWAQFQAKKISKAQLESELKILETAYSKAKIVGRVGRVLTVVGVVFTVADVANATQKSIEKNSYKPLAAEVVRQAGGWGGAIAGGKIGFLVGAAFGIETGPGAIITGAIGAIVFGAIGYFAADKLAGWIEDEDAIELRKDVRSTDKMSEKGVTLIVGATENQYMFCHRALKEAARQAGIINMFTQDEFANAFYPLNANQEQMKNFKMNWRIGDPSNDGKGDVHAGEFENLRGKQNTYFLNPTEVKKLIELIIRGY